MPYRDDSATAYTRRKPTGEPYYGTDSLVGRVHDRVSDRERRDIVTALRNITFFEDDETGEERCEINDVIDALDVHPQPR